jgi:hypothetical protein
MVLQPAAAAWRCVRTCFVAVANEWLMRWAPDERLDWAEAGVSLCSRQKGSAHCCCCLGECLCNLTPCGACWHGPCLQLLLL